MSIALNSDKYRLYLESVQGPEESVAEIDKMWSISGPQRPARLFIEDFSGAAALSAAWTQQDPARRAIAVDIDPEPQAWGKKEFPLATRVQYECVSVLDHAPRESADIIAAMNFSWLLFHTREELRQYFAACLKRLSIGGCLIMDLMAGTDSPLVDVESRIVEPPKASGRKKYKYFWSCRSYDALTARGTWTISWKFVDGSKLKHAFVYDWRLWTLPEVTEILRDLGFKVTVWVDVAEDEDDVDLQPVPKFEGAGVFLPYIVAQRVT